MTFPQKENIAVVILNWNGKHHLEQFLPSVIEHSKDVARIIVVDNASTDDSINYLKNDHSDVELIILKENLGFSGGYNKAFHQINAEYCVLLNSDVEVTPNWITPVIRLMISDETIGACQPKIKSYNQKTHFEYAGAAGGYIDKYGYPFCRGRIFDTLEEDKGQYNDNTEIFWATGACLFIRKGAYFHAGELDPNFFAHMEEIDLCWRMKNKGYKIMYCGESAVFHVGGGTLHKSNPKKTFLNFRNSLLMLYKNLPKSKIGTIILSRLILDGIAGVKFLLQGNIKDTIAILKAHFDFYSMINKYKNSGTDSYPSKIYHNNLVVDYYLKGKKTFDKYKF